MSCDQRFYMGGQIAEQWSNGTQPGDPPAGYMAWNQNGTVLTPLQALPAERVAQLAANDAQKAVNSNQGTIQSRAQAALAANATFQAIASPTNAQVVAEVQLLSKMVAALAKLQLGQLSDTAGT